MNIILCMNGGDAELTSILIPHFALADSFFLVSAVLVVFVIN
jgi:hypothetical protein